MLFRSSLTILIVFASISSGHAQIFDPSRRHRLGRVIAGCLLGGLALILLFVGFCLLVRRRRARAATEFSGPYSTGWPSDPYQGHQTLPPPPQYAHQDVYGWSGPQSPKYPYVQSSYPNQPGHYPPAVPPSAYTQPGNF